MCDDSIVIPYDSIAVNSFEMITGYISVVACFSRYIFAPESAIYSMFLQEEFGGVPIHFIKLFLGLLLSILLVITPNCHSHPFSLLPGRFL